MNAVYGLFLVAGFGNALTNICYQSLLQDRTPDRLRGRVIAASEAVLDFSLLVGAVIAGWIGTALGVRGGFAAAGVIFLVGAAVAALSVGRRAEPVQGDRVASELTFA
jgi:MFS family permease